MKFRKYHSERVDMMHMRLSDLIRTPDLFKQWNILASLRWFVIVQRGRVIRSLWKSKEEVSYEDLLS
jgi:hypothetical protein